MKFFITLAIGILAFGAMANIKAVTDAGDVVVLNDDGTWVYANQINAESIQMTLNPQKFSTPAASSFQLKSKVTQAAFAIDPKKWSFNKGDEGGADEYNFRLKGGDLYAMAITEQLEIAVDTLADVALENAKSAAADMQMTHREYRMVNGLKVIYMEMQGTIQGIKFSYFGYYYSDASGSTQYLVYTGSNLASQYQGDISDFLNGLNVQ